MFSLLRGQCPPVTIDQTVIPQVETVKYLGIHFDKRVTCKNHVSTKRKQLDNKTREIKWLISRHSPLSLENNILFTKQSSNQCGRVVLNYKAVLQIPIWR
jgi:hypothetical protein